MKCTHMLMAVAVLLLTGCADDWGDRSAASAASTGGGFSGDGGTGGSGDGSDSSSADWVERDGVLIIEAEDGVAETADTWALRTDVSDYRGSGFIRWMGSNHFNNKTHGILAYTLKINTPGDYFLRLRAFHDPVAHGTTTDQENDCWTNLKLNSSSDLYKTFRNGSQAGDPWSFHSTWEPSHGTFVDPKLTLTAGVHTFRIAARSQNFMIDRIYLVQDKADLDPDLPASTPMAVTAPPLGIN